MEILLLKKITQLTQRFDEFDPNTLGDHIYDNYGDTQLSVCRGNDSRLSDSRDPNPHTHELSDLPSFLVINTTNIIAGDGLSGGGTLASNVTISHADTSSQGSVTNTQNNFIQSIQLDSFGHIIAITSGNISIANNYVTSISGGGNTTLTVNRQDLAPLTLNMAHIHNWSELVNTPITINGYNITDAYTKTEIDQMLLEIPSGIRIQEPVRVATTVNTTLNGLQIIDNVQLNGGDRVLVKNQTVGSQNGVYIASNLAWTRANDLNESSEIVHGMFYFVVTGDTNGSTGWMLSIPQGVTNLILNTDSITFKQFFATEDYNVGTGLVRDGNVFSVDFDLVASKSHTHDIGDLVTGTLAVSKGGTGRQSITSGEVVIGAGTAPVNTLSRNGIDTRTSFPPSSHMHDASVITTGTLSVARGGTGLSALTSNLVLVGNGTNSVTLLNRSGIDTRTEYPPSTHVHSGEQITTGTIAEARLPLNSDRLRKITVSIDNPSGGSNGDIWFKIY